MRFKLNLIFFFFSRKLYRRLGGTLALKFYENNPWQNYHFAYINSKKNFLINQVDLLFEGGLVNMFAQNQIFSIHPANIICGQSTSSSTNSLTNSLQEFLKTNYPKQKLLTLIFEPLLEKNLINNNLYFTVDNNVHIVDFIRFLNNRFEKNDKPPTHLKLLVKTLQQENIRFPVTCVNNPLAKRLLC